jgi:molybdopterin/thiamine biosynthesis adenylyltransferase
MINIIKHKEFFNPRELKETIHIIGVGAVGSHVAELFARMGVETLYIYDFDRVTDHNITNQLFRNKDIGKLKTDALTEILKEINPDINIVANNKGWSENISLSGYVFLCVDNIDVRRNIVEINRYNPMIKAMFDFRMGLTDGQAYAADWSKIKEVDKFIKSMQFTHDEAKEAVPTSPCGTTLNITPTVKMLTSVGIANAINLIQNKEYATLLVMDAFVSNIVKV